METTALSSNERREAPIRVSVVIPCLDEAENIQRCVALAREALAAGGLVGETIVVDNGSTDGSGLLARRAGARVVEEPRRGYGNAYRAGFAAARGDYVVMIDADLTYDFAEIPRFVAELDRGADLVMGNRMRNIQPGAMPWMNRHIGNPLLSRLLKSLAHTEVNDAYCGMRALRRDLLPVLDLQATGMEFASEMVLRAARARLEISELPIELRPRKGQSKLLPMRDGWRGLRLILVYSPNFVFTLPGALMMLLGLLVMALVLGHVTLFGRGFFIHTLIAGSLLLVLGTQLVGFALCARAYAVYQLNDADPWLRRMQRRYRLEHGLLLGGAVAAAGLAIEAVVVGKWIARGLGSLSEQRLAVVAATLIIVGLQIFFTSFLLSIIGLRRRADLQRHR